MLKDIDIAFTNKVKSWFPNTIYSPTDIVYNVAYGHLESSELSLAFPLISIYRPSGFQVATHLNFLASKQGHMLKTEDKFNGIRFIPINLIYQLDFYAKSIEELNTLVENVLFAFQLDPMLCVYEELIKGEEKYKTVYEIDIVGNVVENSEFQQGDRIFHYATTFEIKNALLYNVKTNISEIKQVLMNLEIE